MNDRLKSRIEKLRRLLLSRGDGVLLGEFRAELKKAPELELIPAHAAFLAVSDGGRFGSVDVWSSDELPQNQFRAEVRPGGTSHWLEIGQVAYAPVFLRRSDGAIELPEFAHTTNRVVPDIDTFLDYYVFGSQYAELFDGAQNDRWNGFLASVSG
jgi:hypothetical protein